MTPDRQKILAAALKCVEAGVFHGRANLMRFGRLSYQESAGAGDMVKALQAEGLLPWWNYKLKHYGKPRSDGRQRRDRSLCKLDENGNDIMSVADKARHDEVERLAFELRCAAELPMPAEIAPKSDPDLPPTQWEAMVLEHRKAWARILRPISSPTLCRCSKERGYGNRPSPFQRPARVYRDRPPE